jgi:hypothetical protein
MLPMGVTQDRIDRLIENEPWGDDQDDEVDEVPEPWREDDPILMPEPVEVAPEPEFEWEGL